MADRSSIEWTDATWNPIRAISRATGEVGHHCEHVSEGCRFCYAERMNGWRGTRLAYKPAHRADVDIVLDERTLRQPLHWRRPRMIFVGSMTDLFADFVPDAMLDRIFAVMALSRPHVFQVLTKRPERMRRYVSTLFERLAVGDPEVDHPSGDRVRFSRLVDWTVFPTVLPNVWLGTSCEDQATADARIPELLATPAAVRFVSAEPLLGPIDFTNIASNRQPETYEAETTNALTGEQWWELDGRQSKVSRGSTPGLDWIIVGGESGPDARPMHPAWVRSIRDQCAGAGVAFHFKQRGAWSWLQGNGGWWPTDADGFIRMRADGTRADDGWPFQRVGKKFAGRLLDGVEHNGVPCGLSST